MATVAHLIVSASLYIHAGTFFFFCTILRHVCGVLTLFRFSCVDARQRSFVDATFPGPSKSGGTAAHVITHLANIGLPVFMAGFNARLSPHLFLALTLA